MGRFEAEQSFWLARILYAFLHSFRTLAPSILSSFRGALHSQIKRLLLTASQQNLYEEVKRVASQFPTTTRARYQAAAASFRAPYWDWAANPPAGETFFPGAASTPTIRIVTPTSNGQKVELRNPLFSYQFKPLNPNGDDFSNLRGTPVSSRPC